MPKAKITKSFVDNTPFTEKGQVIYCDIELAGFYLQVGTRAKTYIVQKDIQGKTVRCTIGRHGHFTPDEARRIAKDKLYLMSQNINPNKLDEKERKKLVTLRMVLESYQSMRKNLNNSTKESYDYHLKKYTHDWLDKLMVDIDKEMIISRHTFIGTHHGPTMANGVMRIIAISNNIFAVFIGIYK